MKPMKSTALMGALVSVLLISSPEALAGRETTIKYRRDLDGDGHYNTKKVTVRDGCGYGYGHYRPVVVRPYYRPGYARPWYGYRRVYYGPAVGATVVIDRPRSVRTAYVRENAYLIQDVQSALARRGYYRGMIDGVAGPRTRAAIRAYQVDRNLRVTGRVDSDLLRSLRI